MNANSDCTNNFMKKWLKNQGLIRSHVSCSVCSLPGSHFRKFILTFNYESILQKFIKNDQVENKFYKSRGNNTFRQWPTWCVTNEISHTCWKLSPHFWSINFLSKLKAQCFSWRTILSQSSLCEPIMSTLKTAWEKCECNK